LTPGAQRSLYWTGTFTVRLWSFFWEANLYLHYSEELWERLETHSEYFRVAAHHVRDPLRAGEAVSSPGDGLQSL